MRNASQVLVCVIEYDEEFFMAIKINKKAFVIIILVLGGLCIFGWSRCENILSISSSQVKTGQKVVVIDAGHGSRDAGKIGVNGALEKEINLALAKQVKILLENQGVYVKMTRTDDVGFYPKTGGNKKLRDMQKRVEFMNKMVPDLVVSIHQNSFADSDVCGAQTFYYEGSLEGERAARLMQAQFATIDEENHRKAKSNDSYYLLKNVKYPIVIAECGFLSNVVDAENLCDKQYQRKIAWAIHMGIMQYLNGGQTNEVDENSN